MTVHEQQLRATFAQCGYVVRLRLLVQPGRPETHALVQMGTVDEAQLAIQKLNGSPPETLGPTLVVRYATNRAAKGRDDPFGGGGGGGGGCCGGIVSSGGSGQYGAMESQQSVELAQQLAQGGPSPLDQLAALQLLAQPHVAAAQMTRDTSLDFAAEFEEDAEIAIVGP
mmetsp:Transcript_6298/g.15499  ORF Transcript_6298/g.15499 Transcript_6298/m.15499 type:complete len:169 (+) Transcript_6298:51-557(+)